MLDDVIEFVNRSFNGKGTEHFQRAMYWVKKLKPDADEAMLAAAYSHDISRAYRKPDPNKRAFPDDDELKQHQEEGGRIMCLYLKISGVDDNIAKKVKELISRHEEGGTPDQNLIKDADSISYFETNASLHIEWIESRGFPRHEIDKKFDWMFARISSDKAREFARPHYELAMQALEQAAGA